MNNLSKLTIKKTTVAILTTLLLIAIAAPLLSFAAAAGAPTAVLGKTSGPNGTYISVTGTGFGASEAVGAISVSVDGRAAGLNVITTTVAPVAGVNPSATIPTFPNAQLKTDATGALSGNIILYGLGVGAHTVIISDATTSVVAGQFTITTPSVTVTPSTVAAGGSVTVSGSGFPTAQGVYTNTIGAASFAGSAIAVASGSTTANPAVLSSNTINGVATVSLPGITTGSAFTLTDAWGNVATTTLSLGTPIVTLSPSSGPVGTVVTATVTGFGPTATISAVSVGNVVGSPSIATTTPTATVTEQGSTAFVFTMPAGTTTTKAGVAGAQAVTVTDSLGNVGTATFTVTPKVALTLGAAGVSSTTTFAPASTTSQLFIQASGLKASTVLSITATPTIPTQWITPSATWTVTTGTYSSPPPAITTDANGRVNLVSDAGTSPAAAGQYSITISDGTTSVSTIVTITTTGNIIAASGTGATPSTGAKGSTVTATYFGAAAPTSITVDGSVVATPVGAVQTWPTVTTNTVTFTITAAAGLHTIAGGITFNSVPFTVLTSSVTVVTPSSASVGTTVTIVGSGFATSAALLSMQGGAVTAATNNLVVDTLIATFVVPNYIAGSYSMSLSDSTGGVPINSATTTFNVAAAAIQITPTSGTPTNAFGSAITIALTGSGFKATDTLTVQFDGTPITALTAVGLTVVNTNGAILIDSGFRIPTAATAGAHTITVLGSTGAYATATYTIIPKLASLSAVRPGAQVTVSGAGFAANSLQSLYINQSLTTWVNTATTPPTTIVQSTVVTGATGNLYSTVGFVVSSTQVPCTLNVTVVDASGYSANTMLTVLGTQAITLGSTNIVAGTIVSGVSISGTGFTPGTRTISANLYSGTTLVTAITLSSASVTVGSTGAFTTLAGLTFTVPASVVTGDYVLRFTATVPTETADANVHVMSAPTLVAPTSAVSGSNVTITVTGLSKITDATFSSTALVIASVVQTVSSVNQFGAITIPASGATAFTTTTWFIVPTGLFAGTYLLTLTDSNTGLIVQAAITVTPTIAITPTTGIKGTTITVTGTGFSATSALTATVNGQAVTLTGVTTTAAGAITGSTFLIPLTATATNTLTITDASAKAATATFTLTTPTIALTPSTAVVGNTVQIIGNGFTGSSSIVVQVAGQVVITTPAALQANAGGSFITYIAVPTGLTGNVTVTATDNSNNVGTAILTVSAASSNTAVPSQTTMTSTAQTTTPSGTAATTFTAGSTVKASFILQSTSGSRDVVVAVTWQQGAKVYNLASFQTTMTTTASTVSFSNLLPTGATGTWTATLQVFASDGVTPLGVTTLTFTVS